MHIEDFYLRQGRYVILGSIDGLLAVLGIVLSLSVTGLASDSLVLIAGLGGAVALALTNGIGSYLAESAVEYGRLARVERALLTTLENTEREHIAARTILLDSVTHGGFSFLGSLIPLLPFIGLTFGNKVFETLVLSIGYLVALGLFSGKVSKRSMVSAVVKMVGMGLFVAVVTLALGAAHG